MKSIFIFLFILFSVYGSAYAKRTINYADLCQHDYSLSYHNGRSIVMSFTSDSICVVRDGTVRYEGKIFQNNNRINVFYFRSNINYIFVDQFINKTGIYEMYICRNGNILWQAFEYKSWRHRKNKSDLRLECEAKLKRNKYFLF